MQDSPRSMSYRGAGAAAASTPHAADTSATTPPGQAQGTSMLDRGADDDDDVEREINERVSAALEELRRDRQPKLDMQARCIERYKQTREELLQRKQQMEQLLA